MKRVEVYCDKCKGAIVLTKSAIRKRALTHSKEEHIVEEYFVCKHCGTEYSIIITDAQMRQWKKELQVGKTNRAAELRELLKAREKLLYEKYGKGAKET